MLPTGRQCHKKHNGARSSCVSHHLWPSRQGGCNISWYPKQHSVAKFARNSSQGTSHFPMSSSKQCRSITSLGIIPQFAPASQCCGSLQQGPGPSREKTSCVRSRARNQPYQDPSRSIVYLTVFFRSKRTTIWRGEVEARGHSLRGTLAVQFNAPIHYRVHSKQPEPYCCATTEVITTASLKKYLYLCCYDHSIAKVPTVFMITTRSTTSFVSSSRFGLPFSCTLYLYQPLVVLV
jgi:hypothetical protein